MWWKKFLAWCSKADKYPLVPYGKREDSRSR